MTKRTSGEREKCVTGAPQPGLSDQAPAPESSGRLSLEPVQETSRRGANAPYIDPPTIPAGMTVETYRRVRERRKPHGVRRLVAHRRPG